MGDIRKNSCIARWCPMHAGEGKLALRKTGM